MAYRIDRSGNQPSNSSSDTNHDRNQPRTTFLSRSLHRVSSYLPDCGTPPCFCCAHQASSDSSEASGFRMRIRQHEPVTRQLRPAESMTSYLSFHEGTPAEILGDSLYDIEIINAIRTYIAEFKKDIISAFKAFNIDATADFNVLIKLAIARLEERYSREKPQIQLYILTSAAELISELRDNIGDLIKYVPKDQRVHIQTIKHQQMMNISKQLANKYIERCNEQYHKLGILVDGEKDDFKILQAHPLRQFQSEFIKRLKQKPDDTEYIEYTVNIEPLKETMAQPHSTAQYDDTEKKQNSYKLPKSFKESFENRPMANQIQLINEEGVRDINLTHSTRPHGFSKRDLGRVLRTIQSYTNFNKALTQEVCQYLTDETTMTMRVFGQYLLEHNFGKGTKLEVLGQLTTFKVRHANNGSDSSNNADTTSIEIEVRHTGQPGGLCVDSFIPHLAMSQYNQLRKLTIDMECKLLITSKDPSNPTISPLKVTSQWQQAPRVQQVDTSHLRVHETTGQ